MSILLPLVSLNPNSGLITLAMNKQATLYDIRRLFKDEDYRYNLIGKLDNFVLVNFGEHDYEKMKSGEKPQLLEALFSRLDAFYVDPKLMAITCHPQPINFRQAVKDNKIILVSVGSAGNKFPHAERIVLGTSIVAQIQMAAMSDIIGAMPYFLYIDEVQSFTTSDIEQMLSQARKFNFGLVLATQFLGQLSGNIQKSIEGNAGTSIAFEIGESDARSIASFTKPEFEWTDLVKLGKHRAAVSLQYGQDRQSAFLLETLPPPSTDVAKAEAQEKERYLRRKSLEKYTPMNCGEVETWRKQRYAGSPPDKPNPDDDFITPE